MDSKNMNIVLVAAALTLSACAYDSSAKFGDSVRHMTGQQIKDLDVAYNPDPAPVVGGDVYKLDDILDAHRTNAANPTEDYGATVDVPIID